MCPRWWLRCMTFFWTVATYFHRSSGETPRTGGGERKIQHQGSEARQLGWGGRHDGGCSSFLRHAYLTLPDRCLPKMVAAKSVRPWRLNHQTCPEMVRLWCWSGYAKLQNLIRLHLCRFHFFTVFFALIPIQSGGRDSSGGGMSDLKSLGHGF